MMLIAVESTFLHTDAHFLNTFVAALNIKIYVILSIPLYKILQNDTFAAWVNAKIAIVHSVEDLKRKKNGKVEKSMITRKHT